MKVLVVDIGGTHVKMLATGQREAREFPSGPAMTPRKMVATVRKLARDWKYDVVSVGYPGAVLRGRPVAEPHNLGRGWVGFDYANAFRPSDQGRQRRGHAGDGKLRGRQDAFPGSGQPVSAPQ
jgi:polyphosphate glucokinase